jgi:hypothetical protein
MARLQAYPGCAHSYEREACRIFSTQAPAAAGCKGNNAWQPACQISEGLLFEVLQKNSSRDGPND